MNELETGWGGREAIGGGPREGTGLDPEAIWNALAHRAIPPLLASDSGRL